MSKSTSTSPGSAAPSTGTASGMKTGLHQPSDDKRIEERVGNVDLTSRGSRVHDHLRDKRGNGVPGYDDSIGHDADKQYVQDNAVKGPED